VALSRGIVFKQQKQEKLSYAIAVYTSATLDISIVKAGSKKEHVLKKLYGTHGMLGIE